MKRTIFLAAMLLVANAFMCNTNHSLAADNEQNYLQWSPLPDLPDELGVACKRQSKSVPPGGAKVYHRVSM